MSTSIYSIWCEWDIGHHNEYFASKAAALRWLESDENLKEVMEDGGYETLEDLFDAGLLCIEEKNLMK